MDMQKIGACLKELRKGKALTQEQLAAQLNTSRRTVSRWETGSNLPDLDILLELADFYEVDLRALLNGECVSGKMSAETKETVQEAADYSKVKYKGLKRLLIALVIVVGSAAALGLIVLMGVNAVKCTHNVAQTIRTGIEESDGYQFAKSFVETNEEILATTGEIRSIDYYNGRYNTYYSIGKTIQRGEYAFRINDDRLVYVSVSDESGTWEVTEWRIEISHSQP